MSSIKRLFVEINCAFWSEKPAYFISEEVRDLSVPRTTVLLEDDLTVGMTAARF